MRLRLKIASMRLFAMVLIPLMFISVITCIIPVFYWVFTGKNYPEIGGEYIQNLFDRAKELEKQFTEKSPAISVRVSTAKNKSYAESKSDAEENYITIIDAEEKL